MASLAALRSAYAGLSMGKSRVASYGRTLRRGAPLGARQTYAVKQIINRGKEKKVIDTLFSAQDVDSLPVITKVAFPAQGLTDSTRIGDKITIVGLRIQGHIQFSTTTGHGRVVIFQWQADDTVAPVLADIFAASGAGAEVDHYNWNNRNKVKILYDRSFNNHSGVSNFRVIIKKYMKPTRHNIVFDDAAVTATKGSIFLMTMGTGANDTDAITANIRLYYRDS